MQIKHVEIINFRNIKHESFELSDRTAICGLNHIGKTNTILAIYWTLTDKLLDGSSDNGSLIPLDDLRALVSVELEFTDGTTYKKTLQRTYTTTRGSDIEIFTGHETKFYKNGLPLNSVSQAKTFLKELTIGDVFDDITTCNKIDFIQAMINPLYLFSSGLDTKQIRAFILSLLPSITDEDVIKTNKAFSILTSDLKTYANTDDLKKSYNTEIKNCDKDLVSSKAKKDYITTKSAEVYHTDAEYDNAESELKELKKLNSSVDDTKEKQVKELEDLKQALQAKKDKASADYQTKKLNADNEIRAVEFDIKNAENEHLNTLNLIANTKERIDTLTKQKGYSVRLLEQTREEYKLANTEEFKGVELRCPKCNTLLNSDDIGKAKKEFNDGKQFRLEAITARGKECSKNISDYERQIEELNKTLATFDDATINKQENTINELQQKLDTLKTNYPKFEYVDYSNEEEAIFKLEKEIATSENTSDNDDTDYKINELQNLLDTRAVYKTLQGDLQLEEVNYQRILKHENELNAKLATLKEFVKTKLNLINSSAKKVFPNLEFVLIEPNIKEDSYNEVCYPKIKGKETPFDNGSNSEKILTGIEIINNIRSALHVDTLPIIFDEGETLDKFTLNDIQSECQLITAVVDNNYTTPTAISL